MFTYSFVSYNTPSLFYFRMLSMELMVESKRVIQRKMEGVRNGETVMSHTKKNITIHKEASQKLDRLHPITNKLFVYKTLGSANI